MFFSDNEIFYEVQKDPQQPGKYTLFGPLKDIYRATGDSKGYVQVTSGKPVVNFTEDQILVLPEPLK